MSAGGEAGAVSASVSGPSAAATPAAGGAHPAKGHRRHESMYALTGLYAELNRDGDKPASTKCHSRNASAGSHSHPCHSRAGDKGHSRNPSFGLIDLRFNITPKDECFVRCHSRNPSQAIIVEKKEPEKEKDKERQPEAVLHNECGVFSCTPALLQPLANIKMFVLLLSFLVTLQQALSSGYINSVITTIEKRFDIPSSLSGLIASSYEIGNVFTVIFVSYLGSRRRIPAWIGAGAVVMGIGSLVFVVPHASSGAGGEGEDAAALAVSASVSNICLGGLAVREQAMPGLSRLAAHRPRDPCIRGSPSSAGPVLLFLLAQLLLGCGGSPLFTLGTTYIDDHVPPDTSSIYIGSMYSMAAFGPVLGFLLGAYLLSFHMDSWGASIIAIDPADHRWVGMWWGGFLLCGVLLILVAVPFFAFPKTLERERAMVRLAAKVRSAMAPTAATAISAAAPASDANTNTCSSAAGGDSAASDEADDTGTSYGKDIKDIPRSMWRLLRNPVYMVTCLGACMELVIVSGFVVFLPKYLETQFSLGKSQASIFTGSIAIPGACIGIFLGGVLLKRLELRPKGAVQFVLVSNVVCLGCFAVLFFLGCDNVKMAGTTMPYFNRNVEPFRVNLTDSCNFGCECLLNEAEPVCGNNGLTYFSPCHAGCTAFSSRFNYTHCACVQGNATASTLDFAEVTAVPVATAGACGSSCRTVYPFLILLFFMTFVVAVTQMPLLMIVLRSVGEEERSFALGMQFVVFRLFGYIPAPILFGNLIDSTCILWKSTCAEHAGRCLVYDIEQFRYRYVGLCAAIKVVALAIFFADWCLVKRRKGLDDKPPFAAADALGSIISLDKLFDEKGHHCHLNHCHHQHQVPAAAEPDHSPPSVRLKQVLAGKAAEGGALIRAT